MRAMSVVSGQRIRVLDVLPRLLKYPRGIREADQITVPPRVASAKVIPSVGPQISSSAPLYIEFGVREGDDIGYLVKQELQINGEIGLEKY
jgi:hypothetical protein